MICTWSYLIYYFVWTFSISRELVVLSCTCHSFCTVKDKILDLDEVEIDDAVMEPYNAELVKCLSDEQVTSDREKDVKSLSECCIIEFFLEGGKAMCVECYFNRQHSLPPTCQCERGFSCCSLLGRTNWLQYAVWFPDPFALCFN